MAGVPVSEETVRPDQIAGMSECFLTATTKDLVPIRAIDEIHYTVGEQTVTMRLKRAYACYVVDYNQAHPQLRV
jgi:branched-subunit amino acid aminotransferase/4-amino-4-deoxychorismate lyase